MNGKKNRDAFITPIRMPVSNFFKLYSDIVHSTQSGSRLIEQEKFLIFKEYEQLSDKERLVIFYIALDLLKDCKDQPLSSEDLAEIKILNTKTQINLKSFIVKTAVILLSIIILMFMFIITVDLIPSVARGYINIIELNWLDNVFK